MIRRFRSVSLTLAFCGLSLVACDSGTNDDLRDTALSRPGPEDKGPPGGQGNEFEGDDCTLTQGYWKNHDAWPDYRDANLCGQLWPDILWIPPRGDAWLILAHQYIAAQLNVANGATASTEIADALARATELLEACAIAPADRAEAIDIAGFLDAFNNGGVGPGHCDGGDSGGEDGGGEDGGGDDCGETGGGDTGGGDTDGGDTGDGPDSGGDTTGDDGGPSDDPPEP